MSKPAVMPSGKCRRAGSNANGKCVGPALIIGDMNEKATQEATEAAEWKDRYDKEGAEHNTKKADNTATS